MEPEIGEPLILFLRGTSWRNGIWNGKDFVGSDGTVYNESQVLSWEYTEMPRMDEDG